MNTQSYYGDKRQNYRGNDEDIFYPTSMVDNFGWSTSNLSPFSGTLPSKWGESARSQYLSAGYSPAAAAQASARAINSGLLDRYSMGDDYVKALMRYASSLRGSAEGVPRMNMTTAGTKDVFSLVGNFLGGSY